MAKAVVLIEPRFIADGVAFPIDVSRGPLIENKELDHVPI